MKSLTGLIFLWVLGGSAFAQDLREEQLYVEKQDAEIRAYENTVHFFQELSPNELSKLNSDADKAEDFVDKYLPPNQRKTDLLDNLDMATLSWSHDNQPHKQSNEEVVAIIGAAYGRYCIGHLKVKWAILSSHFGDGIGLCREKPFMGNFPFTGIRSKVEDQKPLLLQEQYAGFEKDLKDNPNETFDEAAHQKYFEDYNRLWKELGKITLPDFKFQGVNRAEMVKHLNDALHEAHPDTSIRIVFIAPSASEHIDESHYAYPPELETKNTSVSSLLKLLQNFDIRWYVKGREVIGASRND